MVKCCRVGNVVDQSINSLGHNNPSSLALACTSLNPAAKPHRTLPGISVMLLIRTLGPRPSLRGITKPAKSQWPSIASCRTPWQLRTQLRCFAQAPSRQPPMQSDQQNRAKSASCNFERYGIKPFFSLVRIVEVKKTIAVAWTNACFARLIAASKK